MNTENIKTTLLLNRETFIQLCATADRLNLTLGKLATHLLAQALSRPECLPPRGEGVLTGRRHRMSGGRKKQTGDPS